MQEPASLSIDVPIKLLREALIKNPGIILESLGPALDFVSQMDQPYTPISQLIPQDQATKLSERAKEITKVDLLAMGAGAALAPQVTVQDMQIIQDVLFLHARVATSAAFATPKTLDNVSCCCCTPCCCCSCGGGGAGGGGGHHEE